MMKGRIRHFIVKPSIIVVCSLGLILFLSTQALANLMVSVTVYDTVDTTIGYSSVIVDGGLGDTDGLVNSQILLGNNFSPIPNFIVQGSFHGSNDMDLIYSGSSSVTNNRTTTARAYVAISDTDYLPPVNWAFTTGSGTWTNAGGSTIALSYYDDPANGQGANDTFADYADFLANSWKLTPGNLVANFTDTATGALDSFSFNGGPYAVSDPAPYSMTLLFDFNLISGGTLTSRGQAMEKHPIPEPTTLLLLGLGLVGLAAMRRKM